VTTAIKELEAMLGVLLFQLGPRHELDRGWPALPEPRLRDSAQC
jgi:hypothetical protein